MSLRFAKITSIPQSRWQCESARPGALPFSARRAPFRRRPGAAPQVGRAAFDGHALGLEQPALQPGMRFGNQQPPAGANHAMPGDASSARTRRQGVSDRARATGKAKRSREVSIGGDAPARNLFHEVINRFPGHVGSSLLRKVRPRNRQASTLRRNAQVPHPSRCGVAWIGHGSAGLLERIYRACVSSGIRSRASSSRVITDSRQAPGAHASYH